jgi:hypothetical protein
MRDLGIMDYSLLMGIEKSQTALPTTPNARGGPSTEKAGGGFGFARKSLVTFSINKDNHESANLNSLHHEMDLRSRARHRHYSVDGCEMYHISIIDYLQTWTNNKKAERFLKTKFLAKDPKWLSACEPNYYSERFLTVLNKRCILVC